MNKGIKIKNIQAGSLYDYELGNRSRIDITDAVLDTSLLSRHLITNKLINISKNETYDIICMCFSYGTKKYEDELKQIKIIINDNDIFDYYYSLYTIQDDLIIEDCDKEFEEELTNLYTYIKNHMSAEKLREHYYTNDVTITWKIKERKNREWIETEKTITYRYIYRSTGKAKKGQAMMVNIDIFDKVNDWMQMGLHYEEGVDAKIVELASYKPLVSSSLLEGFMHIDVNSVFIIDDIERSVLAKALLIKTKPTTRVKTVTNKETGEEELKSYVVDGAYVDRENEYSEIGTVLFDGQAIGDESLFEGTNLNGFALMRNHFTKFAMVRGELVAFLKDYYGESYETATRTDVFGVEHFVRDIRVLTSINAVKFTKFVGMNGINTEKEMYLHWCKRIKADDNVWGVVKTDHTSKWGKDYQRMSHQMLNTLPTTNEETLKAISQASIDYCNGLKETDNIKFTEYLRKNANLYNNYNMLADLLEYNEDFSHTDYFLDEKSSIISEFKCKRLMQGKLLNVADNLVIFGSPISMLYAMVGKDIDEDNTLIADEDAIQVYTTRFADGEILAGFRSPHCATHCIVSLHNTYNDLFDKYFPNISNNIMFFDSKSSVLQERCSGADMDSDALYVSNQSELVDLAKTAYRDYPTIVNKIKKSTKQYKNTMLDYSKMDNIIGTSRYDIGLSANLAMLATSYYFTNPTQELEDIIVISSVLSQCAIDGAKRLMKVNVTEETSYIMQKDCMKKGLPRFYAEVKKTKVMAKTDKKKKAAKKKLNKKVNNSIVCPMNVITDIIKSNVIRADDVEGKIELKDLFRKIDSKSRDKINRRQVKVIINNVSEYDESMKNLDINDEEYGTKATREMEKLMDCIRSINLSSEKDIKKADVMNVLIERAFGWGKDKDCTKFRRRLLVTLYNKDKKTFLQQFEKQ